MSCADGTCDAEETESFLDACLSGGGSVVEQTSAEVSGECRIEGDRVEFSGSVACSFGQDTGCLRFCLSSEWDPEDGLPGVGDAEETEGPEPYRGECVPTVRNACPPGERCSWSPYGYFLCSSFREPASPVGGPCEGSIECLAGLECVTATELPSCTDQSCCTPWCDVSEEDSPCQDGAVCVPASFASESHPALSDVGLCQVP